MIIEARNVHQALPLGLEYLLINGKEQDSRAGKVIVAPTPVMTILHKPTERVLFWPERDANPFFHLMEALWTLAGRNDIAWLEKYNPRIKDFSDDGKTWHDAYGHRWVNHFTSDVYPGADEQNQLQVIIENLRKNPNDRRCVLTMWDPEVDLGFKGKAFPCNTHAYFSLHTGKLDLTVCCRSNDIIWGLFGSNSVVFSMLLEYMATAIGVPIGTEYHLSNNFHAYENVFRPLIEKKLGCIDTYDPYIDIQPFPLISTSIQVWNEELENFMKGETNSVQYLDPFFQHVALPMQNAHKAYKAKCYDDAIAIINLECKATDWALACREWLERRKANFERAKDDGVKYEQPK